MDLPNIPRELLKEIDEKGYRCFEDICIVNSWYFKLKDLELCLHELIVDSLLNGGALPRILSEVIQKAVGCMDASEVEVYKFEVETKKFVDLTTDQILEVDSKFMSELYKEGMIFKPSGEVWMAVYVEPEVVILHTSKVLRSVICFQSFWNLLKENWKRSLRRAKN